MRRLNIYIKNFIIFIFYFLIIYAIINNIFFNKVNKEGFGLGDINDVVNDIKDVTKTVGEIPDQVRNLDKKLTDQVNSIGDRLKSETQQLGNQIRNETKAMGDQIKSETQQIGNQIKTETQQMGTQIKSETQQMGDQIKSETQQMNNQLKSQTEQMGRELTSNVERLGNEIKTKTEEMGKEIEKKTVEIVTVKLKTIFTQIGDVFNNGIIKPILALFNGIGAIFVQLFNILKELGNKIVSLPSCMFIYMIKETSNTFNFFYSKLVPKFLRDFFSFIYIYTFRHIVEFIGYITGFDAAVDRCYRFNVSEEVDNINSSLSDINKSFKRDFGNIDFSQIKL